ncbi:hypothetical protein [Microbacterium sp. LWH12-1.2]|uniref:hypothetical protein n=1 Tax=Microbacterium sp. LWH12-1.2 TaxID=3135259 RepID=UPI00342B3E3E
MNSHGELIEEAANCNGQEALEAVRSISRMPDRREVVPIDEPVRRHAYLKGYEAAMDDVRARLPHRPVAPAHQSEPSDAQVDVAIRAYDESTRGEYAQWGAMRAALRAAAAAS